MENIAGFGASIGWSTETSTGYTKTGPVIVPKVGDPFFGTDFLGLSRYGSWVNLQSRTDLNVLRQQLQALIDKGPAPYQLQTDRIEKVLRDNVQNWNFYYPNGTSPRPRPWVQDFGNKLKIIITDDGRLTFDRDWEPPHNDPQIHHMVDNVNYFVQQFSDKPYIVLIDHLKRLGKGWKTPDKGSLWHVIHTGDVNFAKLTSFVSKIPGLDAFLGTFGLSTDTLMNYAQSFLAPGANAQIPNVPTNPTVVDGGNTSSGFSPMIAAAAAGGLTWYVSKKPLWGILAAAAVYMIANKTAEPTAQLPANNSNLLSV